ncbi:MAG: response regulator [Candidatus Heimdallarchaeota archaeon]|nr:response regulator [Candidatus Heimdallarchaeota archaeon]
MSQSSDDVKLRIVIAEDSDFYMVNIENILEDFIKNYDIERVTSITALDTYIDELPSIDLMILDMYFPDGNIVDKLVELKLLYPDVITIMVSGQSDIRLAFRTVELGANYYVVKGETFASNLMVAVLNAAEQLRLRRDLMGLRNSVFDPSLYPMVLFQLTEQGVDSIQSDFEEFPEVLHQPEATFLKNIGLGFMLVIGQGHNYHEGCFNVPAGSSKFYTALLFVFRLPNPTAKDPRLKIGYYQMCLFVPKPLFQMFPSIHTMNPLIEKIKAMTTDSVHLIENKLQPVKQMIFDEIKFMDMKSPNVSI